MRTPPETGYPGLAPDYRAAFLRSHLTPPLQRTRANLHAHLLRLTFMGAHWVCRRMSKMHQEAGDSKDVKE